MHKRLEKTRVELERQIAEIDLETFKSTQSDLSGEVSLSEDFADAGTATFDRERDLSLQNNSRDLIAQIDKALRRIDDGSYGTCERCGRSITAARLQALPHVSLCQDCKRREERVR
ncbi:MAG: TraR/DksA C4-type zinc finger protein [Actinomycetota bacterium]|nr:TraR/DksA C4-type zinc finger protein [Actinomycetota bacterium]